MEFHHIPVLFDEVMEWMQPRADGVYADGTLGGGGHSEGILRLSGGTATLYGIDRDEDAIRAAGERLKGYPGFHAIHGNFHDAKALLAAAGAPPLTGALLDLGVSSHQLDEGERGFSYHGSSSRTSTTRRISSVTAIAKTAPLPTLTVTATVRTALAAIIAMKARRTDMTKLYRVLGKRGRITIPYEIRQRVGFTYNDVLSFTESPDGRTVTVKREKICDNCSGTKTADKETEMTLEDFLDSLSAEQQRVALVHLSVKWAEQKAGGHNAGA